MQKSRILAAVVLAASFAFGCANLTQVGQSPEAQIKAGADAVTAVTTTATVLLRNQKITVVQAKSYRNMLGAANEALKDANADLEACRVVTVKTTPDPCWAKVSDVVTIALDNIAGVKRALDAK